MHHRLLKKKTCHSRVGGNPKPIGGSRKAQLIMFRYLSRWAKINTSQTQEEEKLSFPRRRESTDFWRGTNSAINYVHLLILTAWLQISGTVHNVIVSLSNDRLTKILVVFRPFFSWFRDLKT
jgi:hypothetical protein